MVNLKRVLIDNDLLGKKETGKLVSLPLLKTDWLIPESHLSSLFSDPKKYLREEFTNRVNDYYNKKIKEIVKKPKKSKKEK